MSCPVLGSPVDTDKSHRFPLYDEAFTRDPHAAYEEMRRKYRTLAPVLLAPGVPGTLVLDHPTAVRILHDPEHFLHDPRAWQQTVPHHSPLRHMMEWYPAARYTDGYEHIRFRQASAAAIDEVDLHALHDTVENLATPLVESWITTGRAELASQYAFPLVFAVLNQALGCPAEIGQRIAAGMAARFNSTEESEAGMGVLTAALTDLVQLKRAQPGDDMTTRLIDHRNKLDDNEVVAQVMSFYGAGIEAARNLILNTLLLMLTDDRFGGSLLDGSLSTRDALDEVLFDNPPMANFCTTYPRQPMLIDNTWLPANQPVVISIAACNNAPSTKGDRTGNRSHLAFGAGPHACPARPMAYRIAQDAIDYLLDLAPDIKLATPLDQLEWRPGFFHRALTELPVEFTVPNRSSVTPPTQPQGSQPTRR
ncbi:MULTISPECIES: cytochrome P450 [Nocardia]|uniref:cytochrome P450 n=1 Tax=Nocardia TaxID=1817 RepID=UPI00245529F7|nr:MULTISPECIES: cytochrome P450 [Nocardia]